MRQPDNLLGIVAACALCSTPVVAGEYSPIALIVRPADYVGAVYTAPPRDGATHIFFEGEAVTLEIALVNQGSAFETLVTKEESPPEALDLRLTRGVDVLLESVLVSRSPQLVGPAGSRAAFWTGRIDLAPGERVQIRLGVRQEDLAPGVYMLEVRTSLTDASGRPMKPQGSRYQFEVRSMSDDDRCEVAGRQAERARLTGRHAEAKAWVSQMLSANPRSFVAYSILGDIAEAAGERAEALRNYELAISILRENGDAQFSRYRGPADLDDALSALRDKTRRVQGRP